MRKLLIFIFRIRAFLVFLLLEGVSLYLLYRSNAYHNAAFYQSSNYYVGRVLELQSQVSDYFRLTEINQGLAQENALLRAQLTQIQEQQLNDSLGTVKDSLFAGVDSLGPAVFTYRPARVTSNSVRGLNNHLALNVGSDAGIRAGMGVLTANGIVGRVKAVSKHYATVTSLLHSQTLISVKLKRNQSLGSIRWDTENPETASLHYIPLSEKIFKGDSVVTSGAGGIYPPGILVGRVISVRKELDKSFYTILVRLAVDFEKLSYVYVVENKRKPELDSLLIRSGITEANE
ncbi:rod shape-determining protein MreC [Rufibacter glacialis]|uniref:Cell shape-determining protein MreC n=1 Tax=Rufibacter glacialis TaxID=1259555 RepID=A0A5M8QH62_9BACT|nr:rod shape-determining protein MreC [Rufibacter glacialis]KAA6435417.1 rod shape-determining protein MreC [Rufibacter glacialis]GGK63205.1 rod shape-determining protein MreC [Rufibacter glacialis]